MLLTRLAVAGSIVASLASQPVAAQSATTGPYYATPSWDQILPTASRFIILTNFNSNAVLDRETGLVWTRMPLGTVTNDVRRASFDCYTSAIGGRRGWRLPTFAEISSAISIDSSGFETSYLFDPSIPSDNSPLVIFSSTKNEGATNFYVLIINIGAPGHFVTNALDTSFSFNGRTWCVRSPDAGTPVP